MELIAEGYQVRYNTRIGADIKLEQLRQENEAVFISVGIQNSRKLGVEGENKAGINYGVEFLRRAGATIPRSRARLSSWAAATWRWT